jgi:hypothetical protein
MPRYLESTDASAMPEDGEDYAASDILLPRSDRVAFEAIA